MTTDAITLDLSPLGHARKECLFLVWGTPGQGPRSRAFARELGIDVHFVRSAGRRGALSAPMRYAAQSLKTLSLLWRLRPRLVFVQSPPSLAVAVVWLYCRTSRARYVVDAHSAAMLSPVWTWPRRLHRFLAREAVATIVTNEHFASGLRASGAPALVIRDVPTSFPANGRFPVEGSFNVMVVNTFSQDEPLGEVLAAARELEGTRFYVTGDPDGAGPRTPAEAPANVTFTGYLPDEEYYGLMRTADAVVCLTTRDHTMQRGACEALSMGRPILTSDWTLLREYFDRGTVHVDNSAAAIRDGLAQIERDHGRYLAEIARLRVERRGEWLEAVRELVWLVDGHLRGDTEHDDEGVHGT